MFVDEPSMPDQMKRIILVTGTPGVGKSTIARLLAKSLNGVHIDVSSLAIGEGKISQFDDERDTSVVDMNELKEAITRVMGFTEGTVTIDGHLSQDMVHREHVSLTFVLRRAPWILREELESRGYSREKVMENVEAELLDVCLVDALNAQGPEHVCEIDTTDRTPQDVLDEILETIDGKRHCDRGVVDWLGHPESQELLRVIEDVHRSKVS